MKLFNPDRCLLYLHSINVGADFNLILNLLEFQH